MTYSKRFSSNSFLNFFKSAGKQSSERQTSSLEIVFEELEKKKTKDFLL